MLTVSVIVALLLCRIVRARGEERGNHRVDQLLRRNIAVASVYPQEASSESRSPELTEPRLDDHHLQGPLKHAAVLPGQKQPFQAPLEERSAAQAIETTRVLALRMRLAKEEAQKRAQRVTRPTVRSHSPAASSPRHLKKAHQPATHKGASKTKSKPTPKSSPKAMSKATPAKLLKLLKLVAPHHPRRSRVLPPAHQVQPYCGCLAVRKGSVFVETTGCDLRAHIREGDAIRIGNHTAIVVAPRDERTFALSVAYPDRPSKACMKGYPGNTSDPVVVANSMRHCQTLPGTVETSPLSTTLRTSVNLQPHVLVGETIRVGTEDFIVRAPTTLSMLTLSRPFPNTTDAEGTGGVTTACKLAEPWRGNTRSCGCCAVTTKNSRIVHTSRDFRECLRVGDTIRLRTEVFRIEDPFIASMLTLSHVSHLPSASELPVFREAGCAFLPGKATVSLGSNVVNTTMDLRALIGVGDTVEFGEDQQFEIVAAPTERSLEISQRWNDRYSRTENIDMKVCGTPSYAENATLLSCAVQLTEGSDRGETMCDLTPEITVGDSVRLGGKVFEVRYPQDAGTLTLNRLWKLPTGQYNAFLEPVSAAVSAADSRVSTSTKCQSLHCFAKMEEKEYLMRAVWKPPMEPKPLPPKNETEASVHAILEDAKRVKQLGNTSHHPTLEEALKAQQVLLKAAMVRAEELKELAEVSGLRSDLYASDKAEKYVELVNQRMESMENPAPPETEKDPHDRYEIEEALKLPDPEKGAEGNSHVNRNKKGDGEDTTTAPNKKGDGEDTTTAPKSSTSTSARAIDPIPKPETTTVPPTSPTSETVAPSGETDATAKTVKKAGGQSDDATLANGSKDSAPSSSKEHLVGAEGPSSSEEYKALKTQSFTFPDVVGR